MGNIFNEDFRDFIHALNNNDVEYILVGGYSVILHGYVRTTGDMDVWVNKNTENYHKLIKAFFEFGLATFDMTEENFLHNTNMDVFTFGRPPASIEILTTLNGIEFNKAIKNISVYEDADLKIKFLSLADLILSKKAAGRFKDLEDIEQLTKYNKNKKPGN
jgi:predicted nucleotidyltransferase